MKDINECLGQNEQGGDVSTQVLGKICTALDVKIEDIVEVVPMSQIMVQLICYH